jgi:hypothetical protein
VHDEAFCEVATETVNAIVSGDVDALVDVSRTETYDCDGIQSDFFPACGPNVVLDGYIFSTGLFPIDLTMDVLSETAYRQRLESLFDSVDIGFVDDRGDGSPTVLGVKDCGGWSITWTAAVRTADGSTERMGASFAFVTDVVRSHEWYTEGVWLMPLRYPAGMGLGAGPAPDANEMLDELACQRPTRPWRS